MSHQSMGKFQREPMWIQSNPKQPLWSTGKPEWPIQLFFIFYFIFYFKETWREIFEPITERNERESVKSRITFFTLWKSFHFHSSQVGFLRYDLTGDRWSCRVLHVFPLHQPPADMNHWIPLNVCHRFNNHVSYEVLWLMQRTIALWKKFIIAYHVHTMLFKSIIRWTNNNITCSAAILHFKWVSINE